MTWKFRPVIFAKIVSLIAQWIWSMVFNKRPEPVPVDNEKNRWDLNPDDLDLSKEAGSSQDEVINPKDDQNVGGLSD